MIMKRIWQIAALLLIPAMALPVSAQKSNSNDKKQQNATAAAPVQAQSAPGMPTANDASYIIGPSDDLTISVWEQPDLSRAVPVRPDGMISLPLINDIQAAGKTPMQLMNAIVEKLATLGVKSPLVTVTVTAIKSQFIYVLGQVGHPGTFPMIPGMTVLQAIASSGGLTLFAKQTKIEIRRNENGKLTRLAFNYKEVIKGSHPEQDILLRPNDTIVVP
jgi:polysaccharide export outer membrane protein